jgi:hypothetical protein
VDYSLFIMVMMVETLEKVVIPPAEFLPPIFAVVALFWCFCRAFLEEASGVLYIEVFRSVKVRGQNNQANQTTKEGKSMGGVPTPTGLATWALLAFLALHVSSKCSRCFS